MFSMVKFIEEMQHHSVQENSPSDAMTQYEQEGNCNITVCKNETGHQVS